MTVSTAKEISLVSTACFLAYDAITGEVVYIHEIISDADASTVEECPVNVTAIRHKVAREFSGRRLDVIEAPEGFELRQGVSYRVDPASKAIEAPDLPATYREFIQRGLVD